MAGITQTIPQYSAGISEQPDHLKFPGQVTDVINAIPDVTKGLFKRPGSKRIGTDALSSVQSGGSWFHYFRDETEGSYIGQVAADGQVRVWRCTDGQLMTTSYTHDGVNHQTTVQNYLATSEPENLQFLTINDTTFVNSRDTTNANTLVGTTGTTDATPDAHFGFIELLRTENGRQYGVNINNGTAVTTVKRATKIKVTSHTFDESDGSGHCPGIGTEVYAVTAKGSYGASENISFVQNSSGSTITSGKTNLTFRVTALGQQGVSPNYSASSNGPGGQNYRCSYNIEVVLLHGGEGWEVGDVVRVEPEHAATATSSDGQAYIEVTVTEIETTTVKATLSSAGDGLIRPAPTPFDADTAVSADTVLGGILGELPTGITGKIIGNGIYMSSSTAFNVEIVEDDLMRSMGTAVNDVSLLPKQCKHGYIVKVSNSRQSDEDDYYLKFEGLNNQDGTGSWVECAKPGIDLSLTNMPLAIQRTALANPGTSTEIATFTIKQFGYADRGVGDENTNPMPSFVDKRINRVLFFRNRLAFLAGENVVLCRPGTLGEPDFFSETALTVSANDPIDISCSSNFPSELFDGIDINSGLVVFSSNQQFLLSSDDTVLNPDTAKLRSISTFNYNKDIPPVSLGTTVAYLDNSGKFSRFNEMANIAREGEPNVVNQSQVVPTLIPKNVDLFTNSRENNLVLIGKTDSDEVQGFRYLNVGDKRQQSAWFRWKFNNPLKYHFVINDEYYFLDTDNFLQEVRLVQTESDPAIIQDNVDYLLHIDNHVEISGGQFDHPTNKTTFSGLNWLTSVTTPNYDLVVIDTNTASTRVGRYAKATISGTSFTVPGDWSGASIFVGYLYEYKVLFPTFYLTQTQGESSRADVNSSLVIHRMKLHFGKIGLYETTLSRIGKNDYTEVYESTELDEYDVSDAPYVDEFIKTIPVYERNTNVDITLKSQHPAPSTLRAVSWEGDFSPRYYKRV